MTISSSRTCAEWVVPYIGDLIGYRRLHGVTATVSSPRAEVANTIAYRRRKGTVSVVEQLALDVTGWKARAVDSINYVGTDAVSQSSQARSSFHGEPSSPVDAGVETDSVVDRLLTHSMCVVIARPGRGRYNIPNVGLFCVAASALSDHSRNSQAG